MHRRDTYRLQARLFRKVQSRFLPEGGCNEQRDDLPECSERTGDLKLFIVKS